MRVGTASRPSCWAWMTAGWVLASHSSQEASTRAKIRLDSWAEKAQGSSASKLGLWVESLSAWHSSQDASFRDPESSSAPHHLTKHCKERQTATISLGASHMVSVAHPQRQRSPPC